MRHANERRWVVADERKPEDVRALIAEAKGFCIEPTVDTPRTVAIVPRLADACERLLEANLRIMHDMQESNRQLKAHNAALLDLVRRLQWGAGRCELCGRGPFYGDEPRKHATECPIAALGLPADDG
jgi:hypothetical protein